MASGGGLCGAFAIEENQIRGIWCCAELPEHCGHLAAMIRAVVYQVLKHLPERSRLRNSFGGFMFDHSGDVFFFQRIDVANHSRLNFLPAVAKRSESGKIGGGTERICGAAVPALEPEPFDFADVRERVADRAETRADVAGKLLVRQGGAGVERTAVGPGIVFVEKAEIFELHSSLLILGRAGFSLAQIEFPAQEGQHTRRNPAGLKTGATKGEPGSPCTGT